MTTLRFVEKLRDLVGGVDVVLSDIWGVVHNGLVAFPEACEALHTFRKRSGTVILITNAPRPADSVQRQLRKLGIADDTYDAIVTSGDLTRHYVADHAGQKVFWLGPERDNSIRRGLDPVLAPLEQADYIVCTGPFDDDVGIGADQRQLALARLHHHGAIVFRRFGFVIEQTGTDDVVGLFQRRQHRIEPAVDRTVALRTDPEHLSPRVIGDEMPGQIA